jgi:Cu+-exporting ATPase
MHCASCVGRIERFLGKSPGVTNAAVNLATNTATVTYDPLLTSADSLIAVIVKSGYGASTVHESDIPRGNLHQRNFEVPNVFLSALLTLPIVVVAMSFHVGAVAHWIMAAASAVVVFFCGRQFFAGAFTALVHGGAATMDTLIAVGSLSAYAFSLYELIFVSSVPSLYFETAATIITLILVGRLMESRARRRAAESMKSLSDLLPATASKIAADGSELEVPTSTLLPGDQIRVHPGEKLAADGIVTSGYSVVDEAILTGESMPVEKTMGSKVVGGSINNGGSFVFRITAVGSRSVLASIVNLVHDAQGSKAPIQRTADAVSAVFVPAVFAAAIITLLVRLFLLHNTPAEALIPAVAVLVIACPCALGLATPTAIMVSSGRGASLGILIKNGAVLEQLQAIRTVIFDKTGTLTEGKISLTDIALLSDINRATVLRLAASAEVASEHPLAKAIVDLARKQDYSLEDVSDFTSFWGQGMQAQVAGQTIVIGNRGLLESKGIIVDDLAVKSLDSLTGQGKTAILMAIDGANACAFGFADTVRDEAIRVVKTLKSSGIEPVMLTGDQKGPAAFIAKQVGISRYTAELLPAGKAEAVQAYKAEFKDPLAMVGDGVNDAPSLAVADIGIAMGSATDITLSAADITLVGGGLAGISVAIDLSKKTMQIIHQNLFWAFVFNIIGIPLAACGYLNPMLAAFAMAFSSTAVITNSLRLRTIKLDTGSPH